MTLFDIKVATGHFSTNNKYLNSLTQTLPTPKRDYVMTIVI